MSAEHSHGHALFQRRGDIPAAVEIDRPVDGPVSLQDQEVELFQSFGFPSFPRVRNGPPVEQGLPRSLFPVVDRLFQFHALVFVRYVDVYLGVEVVH